jgi:hypothetical protein
VRAAVAHRQQDAAPEHRRAGRISDGQQRRGVDEHEMTTDQMIMRVKDSG